MSSTPELCSLDWLLQQCDCQDKKFNQCVSSTALECKKDLGLLKGPEFAQLQQDAKDAPCPGGRKRNLRSQHRMNKLEKPKQCWGSLHLYNNTYYQHF